MSAGLGLVVYHTGIGVCHKAVQDLRCAVAADSDLAVFPTSIF